MLDSISQEKRLEFTVSGINDKTKQLTNQKRQVRLKTCADVYSHWRSYKRQYKRAPKDGVEFQIEYIDTGLALNEEERSKAPIALALHGAPGSYHDFSLLIAHLTRQKVRVIAPNFPEYVATVKTKVLFRHSADEKAAYLRDFLKAIEVKKIDLLVSHSSAIFPTLLILLNANSEALAKQKGTVASDSDGGDVTSTITDNNNNNNNNNDNISDINKNDRSRHKRRHLDVIVEFDEPIEIRAVALFNPAGHRLPKSMKPTWYKCGSVRVYQHKLGRSIYRKLGPAFLTVVGVPVRVDNMDNVMLSATVMRNSKCQRVVRQLEQLSQMKIPTLLVFSENDKLIEKEIFYEMTQFMKLDPNNFDVFNNDGDIELSQSRTDDWIRVMVFKAGGHYAYSNYASTVNQAVSELLSKVTPIICSN
uniref:Uncharacterized protein n=1 Tax=Aceria tosichella TaxID=561515 RepID=A0A6G1SGJ0_9ACAR